MSDLSYSHCITLDDFRKTSILDGFHVNPNAVDEGQVMVKVDKLALTANSISYVLAHQEGILSYLDSFPAPEGLAHIPCWGYGDVVYSKSADVAEGERLYGFFPIASHVILTVGEAKPNGFTDTSPGRDAVAPFYSEYNYARKEPGYAPEFEDTVMLFRPLFGTSYLLQSFCQDHEFFGADRVIVTSASSKTAMGFGYLLQKKYAEKVKAIGLTSPRNHDFVVGLDCFNEVLTYDQVDLIDRGGKVLFFDVAGDRELLEKVHLRMGDAIAYSGQVGRTHWDADHDDACVALPGAKPVFWSGPDQVMKLRERHGGGGMMKVIGASMVDFLMAAHNWIKMMPAEGPEAIDNRVRSVLDGGVNANEGVVLRP